MRARRSLAILPLLAVLLGCAGAPAGPPRHVFLITVDTLRADHMGMYGYPRATSPVLDAMAAEGVLFERAICQYPKTTTSFASIFTGQYPLTTGMILGNAQRLPDRFLTLPEVFHNGGFTTLAVVSNGVLPARRGWSQGFDAYRHTLDQVESVPEDPLEHRRLVHAHHVNRMARELLARHRDAERLFVWLHYSDPHTPYVLPDGVDNPFVGDEHYLDRSSVGRELSPARRLGAELELRHYVAAYDANVRYVDQQIGEMLAHLRATDLLDDSLVIFTSDHGESLGEHGLFFQHGPLPYNTTARVPLLVWGAGLERGRRIERPVELVDLYPTLRDLFFPEATIPGLEGESWADLLELPELADEDLEPFAVAFAEAGGGRPKRHFRFVQNERWKLVYHPPIVRDDVVVRPPWEELYDLVADPGETRNLVETSPAELDGLRSTLLAWMRDRGGARMPAAMAEPLDPETEKALRALGYIE